MLFRSIIFYFFGDFSVIKARELHQTRCETCPFDALADGKLIRTNHSDSELRGPRICNHGQESWEKFAL